MTPALVVDGDGEAVVGGTVEASVDVEVAVGVTAEVEAEMDVVVGNVVVRPVVLVVDEQLTKSATTSKPLVSTRRAPKVTIAAASSAAPFRA